MLIEKKHNLKAAITKKVLLRKSLKSNVCSFETAL